MPEIFTSEEISKGLANAVGWKVSEKEIEKTFEFKDFREALEFVNKVGKIAEEANHHPEIEIHYNKVEIELSTHSAGGVTQKDLDLALKIDGVNDES